MIRMTEGKAKGELVCNRAYDLNNKEFTCFKFIIARSYIAACIITSSKISLVRRSFLPKGARLVPVATTMTGINDNQVNSGNI